MLIIISNPLILWGLPVLELSEAMLLTELGNRRQPEVFRAKMDAIYSIAVEPNPVCG